MIGHRRRLLHVCRIYSARGRDYDMGLLRRRQGDSLLRRVETSRLLNLSWRNVISENLKVEQPGKPCKKKREGDEQRAGGVRQNGKS